jgi:hypothetical protein
MTIQELLEKRATKIRNTKGIGYIEVVYKDDKPIEFLIFYPKKELPQKVLVKDAKNILNSQSLAWEVFSTQPEKKKK